MLCLIKHWQRVVTKPLLKNNCLPLLFSDFTRNATLIFDMKNNVQRISTTDVLARSRKGETCKKTVAMTSITKKHKYAIYVLNDL